MEIKYMFGYSLLLMIAMVLGVLIAGVIGSVVIGLLIAWRTFSDSSDEKNDPIDDLSGPDRFCRLDMTPEVFAKHLPYFEKVGLVRRTPEFPGYL
jgi:hypothetical protein